MNKTGLSLAVAMVSWISTASASSIEINNQNFKLSGEKAEITTMHGKKCISLYRGKAELVNTKFANGTIEYDVAFDQSRSFVDVEFRKLDDSNSEKFYIRPHQSGNPDANQYTPVYNDLSAWQLYHEGFGNKVKYKFNDWNRVKINVW